MGKTRTTLLVLLAAAPLGTLLAATAAIAPPVAAGAQARTPAIAAPAVVTNGKKAEKRAKPKATKKPRRPSHAETPASGSK